MTQFTFTRATKAESKLRLALLGPAGGGKTYTALCLAKHLGRRIAVLDTEHGSASKYADLFEFDCLNLESFNPRNYIAAIHTAEAAGYDVLIIDSLSHAWAGKDGLLEFVDTETDRARSNNKFTSGWRTATPLHNDMIDSILAAGLHVIATMRTKMTYVLEEDDKGKKLPKKIGLQPVQRDGMEYEFDVIADLDQDNTLVINKSRCFELNGKVYRKPDGKEIAAVLTAWLQGAKTAPPPPAAAAQEEKFFGQPPAQPVPAKSNGHKASPKRDSLLTAYSRLYQSAQALQVDAPVLGNDATEPQISAQINHTLLKVVEKATGLVQAVQGSLPASLHEGLDNLDEPGQRKTFNKRLIELAVELARQQPAAENALPF